MMHLLISTKFAISRRIYEKLVVKKSSISYECDRGLTSNYIGFVSNLLR